MLIAHITTQTARRALATIGLALSITAIPASTAQAHCDTMDGPVVAAAKRALDTGAEKYVLIWVRACVNSAPGRASSPIITSSRP